MTRLAIASDHAGLSLKRDLVAWLTQRNTDLEDLGTYIDQSCDYPDFAHAVAQQLRTGRCDLGVLVCGSGVGMSMAANRHPHVRAAVVSDPYSARMAREHNHANVLCLGARVVGGGLAIDILRAWLEAEPDCDPRHVRRVEKIELG